MKKIKSLLSTFFILLVAATSGAQEKKTDCKLVTGIGKYSGACEIPKEELKGLKELKIISECAGYFVFSYDVTIKAKNQPVMLTEKGTQLSKNVTAIFNTLNPSDKIYIDNVKANSSTEKGKPAGGITITVK